ncbi:TraU family protein (plasmid) [Psychrobium sp. nBUS_13]|uniref:TraU family protein n=1 Tax=Psychrobium sp. nBUS_13 TaxID=3395319 RepID=UPI003EB77BB1
MNFFKLFFIIIPMVFVLKVSANAADGKSDFGCNDAKIFSGIVEDICWSCFLPVRLMGAGSKPDGAADSTPLCMCKDRAGIPEFGYQLGMWKPARLIELVTTPWCSPSLGGIKLQDDLFSLGAGANIPADEDVSNIANYQYHYFSFPIFEMLEILYLPNCGSDYVDFDLMYLSELDPTWQNDLLAIVLSPEAVIFANPIAKAWCTADCILTTNGVSQESTYGCAGCDGSLYPFTGNVNYGDDPVRVSSLLSQRVLASLHRKGLARKTIGNAAMCKAEFWPMIPKSQYKMSMLYPVPEASSDKNPMTDNGTPLAKDRKTCCHPLGESIHKWSTAAGGRVRPGKEDFVYMAWRYSDCCVINQPAGSD